MDSKLIKKWKEEELKPSSFEFFTNRPDMVMGKLPNQDAQIEYVCPSCQFYEIKSVPMERSVTKSGKPGKKFDRPEFPCSKCNKTIEVAPLKKK